MGFLDDADALIADAFSQWSSLTTLLAVLLGSYVVYVVWSIVEPDTHPMLLQRQSNVSPVRQPGESATYRSTEIPHGYPLRTGLNVKKPGAPAYSAGKDGDLRDIWKRVTGALPIELPKLAGFGKAEEPKDEVSRKSKILTVLGREKVIEHETDDLTREINAIGATIKERAGKKVAVYLPNSVELLTVVFAGAFYGFTPVLLPYNIPHDALLRLLARTSADTLIAQAGSLPIDQTFRQQAKGVRQIIWLVEEDSKQIDWTSVEGPGLDVDTWHDIVAGSKGSVELPEDEGEPTGIVTVSPPGPGTNSEWEIVEFSQKNLVSATAALTYAVPLAQRVSPSDLFLPASPLTTSYTLCLTLSALFTGASLALNSVAGPGVHLPAATRIIAPTVIAIDAETAIGVHESTSEESQGFLKRLAHRFESQALAQGAWPVESFISRINPAAKSNLGATPGSLRLVFISSAANGAALSSAQLGDLRIFTGARIIQSLTDAQVAGAITQTHAYDYRVENGEAHFGAPLSSVEIKLVDKEGHVTTDDQARGEVIVQGPSVSGGKTNTGLLARWREDGCLALV